MKAKWMAAGAAFLAGLYGANGLVQASTIATHATPSWGTVSVSGKSGLRSSFLTYKGTTYFGIWYLQQLLKKQGINPTWDGTSRTLSLEFFPKFNAKSTLRLNGQVLAGAHTMNVGGSIYVDATAIAKAEHWPLKYTVDGSGDHILTLGDNVSPIKSQKLLQKKKLPTTKEASVPVTQKWGTVTGFQNVSIVQAQGTSYFGIWYLAQMLKQYGYGSTWNARSHTFSINPLPTVIPQGNLVVGDNAEPSALISYLGHWYLPMSTLFLGTNIAGATDAAGNVSAQVVPANLGTVSPPVVTETSLSGTVNGTSGEDLTGAKVAIVDDNGKLTVANVSASDGSFTATLSAPSGHVIGLYTTQKGWFGNTTPIAADTPATLDTTERESVISGLIIPASGEKVANSPVVLRSDLTHTQYSTKTDASGAFALHVPAGQYEVWTVGVNGHDLFVGQRFLAQAGDATVSVHLPALPTSNDYSTAHAIIEAQTPDVTGVDLLSLGNLFERIYQYDTTSTGFTPTLPIVVAAYGNTDAYTQHFLDEGASLSDAENYGENSQAVTESNQYMAVNLDGLDPEFGVNVLAHEFTHALIANVSEKIPDWVNEGLAWHQGNGAQEDVSPVELVDSSLKWDLWDDIVNHASSGDLIGLGQVDTMGADYNVEAEDNFAVEQLIQQFGFQDVLDYVKQIDKADTNPAKNDVAFQSTFGMSEPSFASQMETDLNGYAAHKDAGMSVTIHILPGGPTQILVSNPDGRTTVYNGAVPEGGQLPGGSGISSGNYTFKLNPDGTVVTPKGLTSGHVTEVDGDGNWYIGANHGEEQGLFAISNDFNLGFLVSSLDFVGDNDPVVETSSDLPFGLRLISITPS